MKETCPFNPFETTDTSEPAGQRANSFVPAPGHAVLYWVDAHSGHVQFVQPSNGEIIDLARLGATIKEHLGCLGSNGPKELVSFGPHGQGFISGGGSFQQKYFHRNLTSRGGSL